METFWGFFGLWCLLPLLLVAALALMCLARMGRRDCACSGRGACDGGAPGQPPRGPAA